jgi:hypothetical protein
MHLPASCMCGYNTLVILDTSCSLPLAILGLMHDAPAHLPLLITLLGLMHYYASVWLPPPTAVMHGMQLIP